MLSFTESDAQVRKSTTAGTGGVALPQWQALTARLSSPTGWRRTQQRSDYCCVCGTLAVPL